MVSLSFDTMSIPQGTRFRPAKLHVPRRGDAQEHGPRAALLRVQAGGAPVWPDVAVGTYRLNLGAARARPKGLPAAPVAVALLQGAVLLLEQVLLVEIVRDCVGREEAGVAEFVAFT